jgi:hypothetical protein
MKYITQEPDLVLSTSLLSFAYDVAQYTFITREVLTKPNIWANHFFKLNTFFK